MEIYSAMFHHNLENAVMCLSSSDLTDVELSSSVDLIYCEEGDFFSFCECVV